MHLDCGFQNAAGWFRYRAAAIIIENDCVLMATNNSVPYYYSIGGGVHLHESAEQAVLREVYEETGYEYEIDRLVYLHENFFVGTMDNAGLQCHEIALYFLMKPRGILEFSQRSHALNGAQERVCWVPIAELGQQQLFPSFLQHELPALPSTVKHIVTYE